jgi:hypothetical protein
MIMCMGRDYVSKLLPPAGLLFILRWYMSMENLIERYRLRKTAISSARPLWKSYQQSCSMKQEERVKRIWIWPCEEFFHACKRFFVPDMWPLALLPLRRKVYCGFLSPWKTHRLGRVWTREPWMASRLTITPPRRLTWYDGLTFFFLVER